MLDHLPKINFITLMAAALLFFLPWTTIQCNGRSIATQSGAQAIYGSASLSDDLKTLIEKDQAKDADADQERLGMAHLIAIAALCVLVGLVVSGLILFKGAATQLNPGLFAAIALALILLQTAIGFPINNELAESRQETAAQDDDMAKAVAATMAVSAPRTTWFYLELVLLAVPAGLYIHQRLPKQTAAPDPTHA